VITEKCKKIPYEMIFQRLKVFSEEETLNEIIVNNKSISRFGDGEFELIFGNSISFQKYNKTLSKKLIEVLNSNENNLLIGINIRSVILNLNKFEEDSRKYYIKWLENNKFRISKIINQSKNYYSSRISRFYIGYKNKTGSSKYIALIKKIWDKKDILIIEGDKTLLGIGNDLINNSNSIKRIICPNLNAFDFYDKIINEVIKINKNILILIALGPTATVLSYDLSRLGYQAIDIGHIDIEYEWFLKNATKKIKIKNKYVNEVDNGLNNFTSIKDRVYYKQIIKKIS
jgi:glycosyltransferase family protein